MISSVSEMYPIALICLCRAWDSFCVAWRFWLSCHTCNKLWTLAILCNFLSSASLFSSISFAASVVCNTESMPANIPLSARAYCLTTTFWQRVSPMGFDCLHPIRTCPREKQASTLTPCGIIENRLRATLDRPAYIEHGSSRWCHQ